LSYESALSSQLLDDLTGTVSRAAAAVLAVRDGALAARRKADQSPVTAADEAAEAVILAEVARLLPGVPVVSEEAVDRGVCPPFGDADMLVLVDPVDGTRELVAGRDEFTVNLAIVIAGSAQLGIIAAPARGLVWRTCGATASGSGGGGAERLELVPGAPVGQARSSRPVRSRAWPQTGPIAAVSRSHLDPRTEAWLARLAPAERLSSGSAIKFCQVAEGLADVYPRLSPTREWDVAAGAAIVSGAGGVVTTPEGEPLTFGRRPDFLVSGFIARGDPAGLHPEWA
jgi:3'(2'), 5'-bisphosphate nucleotidase